MKILFVTLGTERVAASRYRVCQYLSYLKSQGVKFDIFSIISDFATRLAIRSPEFNSWIRFVYYIYVFFERFFRFWVALFKTPFYDVLFLQRATFPFGLAGLLSVFNKNIIFDIDDAIFMPDSSGRDPITRLKGYIKESELAAVLRVSKRVIVENDYIKDYVSKYCKNVHKIPGPIDTDRYFVKPNLTDGKEVVIGWIGSPATTSYLHMLDNVFKEILGRFNNVKIVLIGAGNYEFFDSRVVKVPWSYDTEVEELQKFNIGIMPMPDDEWTRGKLGCKMLQYMAVGVPAVVSYTATNAELIADNKNGFLVKALAEWISRLSQLINDRDLRESIGMAGRQTVDEICSVKKNGPRLLEIFDKI
jgi:glycosyltransferase involved in cell wall biosynthesis